MNHVARARGEIVGIVSAVPENVVTNEGWPDAVDAAEITGVLERRVAVNGESTRELCTQAAQRLMARLGWSGPSLDLIVFVTQTPQRAVPADVYDIAIELGASCPCVEVNWSCSGYVNGLWATMRLLEAGKRALLLVGDVSSAIMDPKDRATGPLFGDAGTATAIMGGGSEQLFWLGSDGFGAGKLVQNKPNEWLRMNGAEVFTFTLKRVPPLLADVLSSGLKPPFTVAPEREAHVIAFHQANKFILEHLVRKAVPEHLRDRVPINIDRFGNCSSASIPVLLCTERAALLREGAAVFDIDRETNLALLGYGAGYAWAGASISCPPLAVCELIEV